MSEISISRVEGIEREGPVHSTAALKTFVKEVTLFSKPLILDLGCISDSNIQFFTHLGCKVFVKDILNANIRAWTPSGYTEEISVDEVQIDFEYPDNFFDGLLFWDIFDHFDLKEAQLLLNKAKRVLKEKGWALALFRPPSPTPFNILTRYRIISLGEIKYETLPLTTQRFKVYHNSDIGELFNSFSSFTSYLPKNRWREVIVRK
jgi:hypothetical protein